MRLNHPDYIKLVIGTYRKKRGNNELSLLLAQPTPANIKRACLHVYEQRYRREDEQILVDFFGPAEPGRQFLQLIRQFETSRFKPLNKYLKGGTENTDDVNVGLLAWLIDFRHRPFVFDKEVILSEEEILIIADANNKVIDPIKPESENEEEEEPEHSLVNEPAENTDEKKSVPNSLPDVPKNNKEEGVSKALVFFLLLILGAGGIYTIWQKQQDKQLVMGNANTGCMYWAEDHYEAMPCNEELKGRLKLPMDSEKMKNFQRITREDTITEKSIGKIYYIRINGGREYYTAGGNHPVEVTRTLKKLSRYMFDEHLRKQEVTTKIP